MTFKTLLLCLLYMCTPTAWAQSTADRPVEIPKTAALQRMGEPGGGALPAAARLVGGAAARLGFVGR